LVDLLKHWGLLRGLIACDNAQQDPGHVQPLVISDGDILRDFFRLPDEVEGRAFQDNLMDWKHYRTLQACLRPGIFGHLKALLEVAPWVMAGMAPSGLRDLGNAGMTRARIACFLIS
jgi:hypothetical protein